MGLRPPAVPRHVSGLVLALRAEQDGQPEPLERWVCRLSRDILQRTPLAHDPPPTVQYLSERGTWGEAESGGTGSLIRGMEEFESYGESARFCNDVKSWWCVGRGGTPPSSTSGVPPIGDLGREMTPEVIEHLPQEAEENR